MNLSETYDGVWFVYDGECPVCGYVAHALKIKRKHGSLHLLDARNTSGHPILKLISDRGLDLDEGMIIFCDDRLYHGKDALKFMAKYGDASGALNIANKSLFWSEGIATLMYPWMRGARNALLRRLNKSRIDNLRLGSEPIFKSVFGQDWDSLPEVLKKHYANRPYSADRVTVEGVLDVTCRSYMRLLRPFFRLLGSVPALTESNAPVTVQFKSEADTRAFHFNRVFCFSTTKPYYFRSRMLQVEENEVIEIMRFGFSWCMTYGWDGEKVTLRHKGYALNVFGHYLPLPISWLLGRGDANETAVNDDQFDMDVTITHPIFGIVYSYAGRFKVTKEA